MLCATRETCKQSNNLASIYYILVKDAKIGKIMFIYF